MDERYRLQGIDFEWDVEKANSNRKKHGISFILACEAFFDPFLVPFDDEIVEGEIRYIVVGMSINWQLLYVVFVWRGDVVRLVSARLATSRERKIYESGTT